MFKFDKKYFAFAVFLFIIEVLIAVYIDDSFIRPYFGDFLVVILIYCFVKAFCNVPVIKGALFVLLFAYTIEILQYFKFVKHLGLKNSRIANIVLGNSFGWADMVAYTLGILSVVAIENYFNRKEKGVL